MRLISRRPLRAFWESHSDAKASLEVWINAVRSAKWQNFMDVKKSFNTADSYKKAVIFNIAQNRYRLIVVIHYNTQRVYVRNILTHKEYDLGKWKDGL